jgi:hypothetical protein
MAHAREQESVTYAVRGRGKKKATETACKSDQILYLTGLQNSFYKFAQRIERNYDRRSKGKHNKNVVANRELIGVM